MKPSPPEWDKPAIKAEIERRRMTLAGIEKDAGLRPSACRKGLRGENRQGAEAIAKALGIPFRTLFPSQYLPRHVRAENTAPKPRSRATEKPRAAADRTDAAA